MYSTFMKNTDELAQEIATLSAHLDAATHRLLQCIRDFDQGGGWCEQGAVSCAHWLSWRVGWDPGTARERVRVARALGTLPAIDAALCTGSLSYAKVRALTRVANPQTEAKLLGMAFFATGAQLERLCRGYRGVLDSGKVPDPEERSVRRRQLPGGKVKLELVLEADEAELVLRAVDRAREEMRLRRREEMRLRRREEMRPQRREEMRLRRREEMRLRRREVRAEQAAAAPDVPAETPWPSQADGMVGLAESFLAGNPVSGNGGERFQVMVHLDQEALGPDGALAGTLEDGSRVSSETFRRVACDCGLVAVAHDGQALNIGRRTRSIPPAIRRALRLRDHGCAFPGCSNTRFVHAHHVEHWLHGGSTSLENLVMLCTFHHRLVHEGGWRVSAEADGVFCFHSPAGSPLAPLPPREPVGDAPVWLQQWAAGNGLDIGPETNFPQGDGSRPDYDLAVGALLDAC